jgi:hypothetical protein
MHIGLAFLVSLASLGTLACSSVDPTEPYASTSHAIDRAPKLGPAGCGMTADEARARGLDVHDLTTGQRGYTNPSPNGLALFNRTGTNLQLEAVSALPSPTWISSGARDRWAELCVHIDDFAVYPDLVTAGAKGPGQPRMGIGEVGCMFKLSSEAAYRPLRWGTPSQPTALAVPPGSCVVVGGGAGYDFLVDVGPETQAVHSVRQPAVDHVFDCNDERQSTPWRAWTNDTGRTLRLLGASIYAAAPEDAQDPSAGTHVDGACVHLIDAAGQARTHLCSPEYPLSARGELVLPATDIPPGWSLGAQAVHQCRSPSFRHWGWAAFLHVY